ncbi:acetyl-CoA carboxylase, biotin carboxyl carrier protein, partial [Clavibacter lycopersici]
MSSPTLAPVPSAADAPGAPAPAAE